MLYCSIEPLYQVYNRRTLLRERSISRRRLSSDTSGSDEAFLEELARGTLRNMRVLWSELPEVGYHPFWQAGRRTDRMCFPSDLNQMFCSLKRTALAFSHVNEVQENQFSSVVILN